MSSTTVNLVFALLLPISLICSIYTHRWMKRPKAGVVGQLIGVMFFLSIGGFIAFMAYLGLMEGSIHCFGRRCQSNYSLEQEPGLFWFAFSAWYAAAALVLSVGVGGIRLMLFGPSSEP